MRAVTTEPNNVPTEATPSPKSSIPLPPKPTALPEEEIYTITPTASTQANATPVPTAGFEAVLATFGLLSVAYIAFRKK